MTIEEKILLNEIKKKNREVFEFLFDQYYPILVKFSEGYLHDIHACEDVVQTFFISFWTGSENMNITTSIKSYFFTSVKNLCLNRIRDLKVRDKHEIQYVESLINIEPDEKLIDPEILFFINKAVESLPSQMSEIFRQKYFQGKQVKEIASILDVTEGTVKTQLFRARAILRNKLLDLTNINFIL
uniref:RNA polymerase sigma factor n=1 Tax=uncultured Draconibacterium sp. TaxID=1573823 RepID=UPI0032162FA5